MLLLCQYSGALITFSCHLCCCWITSH
jgi:hypothetical protein